MERAALFAGTFDPWTHGHQDVLRSAVDLFDRVVVALLTNPEKDRTMFDSAQRQELVRLGIMDDPSTRRTNIEVITVPDTPAVEVAVRNRALWMVRGLRLSMEYEKELSACLVNACINGGVQTIYIPPKQEHIHISSSVVRNLINLDLQTIVMEMVPGAEYRRIAEIVGWQIS